MVSLKKFFEFLKQIESVWKLSFPLKKMHTIKDFKMELTTVSSINEQLCNFMIMHQLLERSLIQ